MHTRLQPHPRLRARAFFICLLFASFSAALFLHLSAQTAHAASGIYKTINFQGKVVNTDGTNVANGSYSFVFSLYDASSGGSQLWTETQTLTVTDGIFRANLGSVTPISSVNFNTDSLYLEINFNSDGVMSPRVRFAAVPYAFEADQVNGLSVTNNGSNTLNIAAGKTLKVDNSIEFIGTDTTAMTLPTLSTTLAGLSIAQTFTNAQTITPTQNSTNALSINGTSGTAATALVVAQTGNASGVSITGSSSETASDLVTITDAVFAPAASATVSGINLSFTNLSTNATGTSTTAGISINPTVNVTSGAGTHTTIGLNFPALTATCTAGTCLKYGLYFPSSNNYTDILNYSGTSVINASGQLNLSSVTNTLGIANGGTNAGSFTATNGVIYYDGSKLASTAASSGTQCLQTASAGAAPTWGSCGSGSSQWTTSGSNIYYTTGKVGIGTTSPNGLLDVSSTTLSGVGTLTGPLLSLSASTYQATTNADMAFNSIAAPTLTAAASQTTTNAYTLYIAGAPTAGTSETITNAYALGVNGNALITSTGTAANLLNIQGPTGAGTTQNLLNISGNLGANGDGLNISNTVNDSTGQTESGISAVVIDSPTTTANGLYGAYIAVYNNSSLANTLMGIRLSAADESATGGANNLIGIQSNTSAQGSSGLTVSTAKAGYFYNLTMSGNTITTGYGVYIDQPLGSGTIGTNYGLYIGDQSIGATSSYNIYSAGASTKNYFAGKVLVGTTNAGAKLNIGANSTTIPQINFASSGGTDVTSPSNGDLWWDGTHLYFYNGADKDLLASGVSSQWTTSGSNIYYTTGKVGIGTTSPNGLLDVSSTTLSGVGTLTGPLLSLSASTYQATTNADMAFNSIAAPTLTAAASQTTTNAYTLYVAGAPTAGTSETISHAFALGVNGNSYLNGNVGIGTTSPAGLLDVSKTLSGAGTLTGPYLSISASTYTATSNADMAFNSIAQPTLQASAFQTTTNAYTLYIAGGPIPGTNELITNALALGVGGSIGIQFGNSLFLYNAGNTAYSAIAFDGTYTNVSWPLRLNINSSNPILTVAQTGTGYAAIFTGGNVGINNTTPTAKLDVGIPTTGTATNIKAPVATTQTGSLTGELIDLNTNFTALAGTNGTTTTGISLKTPTLTESTASVTDSVYGLNLGTTGALTTQTNSSTAINWYGANITMPNITQTAGTLTSTGVSITPGSVTTGGTQYGININTNSASVGTNTAINIGSGWGKAINIPADSTTTAGGITFGTTTPVTIYRSGAGALSMGDGTNSFTVNTTSGPAYAGTARPTKVITLSPEYAGAVLTAFYGAGTDTSITGNMTSDAETSSTNNLRTYYQWTSTQASLNYYTVAVRVTLPQDFSAWAASNPLTIDYDTQSNSSANNSVDARVYLQSNSTTAVTSSTGNVSATGGTYATISFTNSNLTGGSVTWNAAGQQAVIYLRVGSLSSNYVRLGDIKLTYLAAY